MHAQNSGAGDREIEVTRRTQTDQLPAYRDSHGERHPARTLTRSYAVPLPFEAKRGSISAIASSPDGAREMVERIEAHREEQRT